MPLIKSPSKSAFRKNVATEVKSGKPIKQSVAIAYSVKREAAKKGKKAPARKSAKPAKRPAKKTVKKPARKARRR